MLEFSRQEGSHTATHGSVLRARILLCSSTILEPLTVPESATKIHASGTYVRATGPDPRDVFLRELDLPRGPRRERVFDRDRDYTLRGSESRTSKASVTALDSTVDAPTIVNLPAL